MRQFFWIELATAVKCTFSSLLCNWLCKWLLKTWNVTQRWGWSVVYILFFFVTRPQEGSGKAATGWVCLTGEGGSRAENLSSGREYLRIWRCYKTLHSGIDCTKPFSLGYAWQQVGLKLSEFWAAMCESNCWESSASRSWGTWEKM